MTRCDDYFALMIRERHIYARMPLDAPAFARICALFCADDAFADAGEAAATRAYYFIHSLTSMAPAPMPLLLTAARCAPCRKRTMRGARRCCRTQLRARDAMLAALRCREAHCENTRH